MVGISKDRVVFLLHKRLNRILLVAEVALPERQYQAFRKCVLDEFGRNGLEKELGELAPPNSGIEER